MIAFPDCTDPVEKAISTHVDRPGALLPILHDVQDALDHIPPDALLRIANALNLSRAEVHGVVTYYHHFRTAPLTGHVIQLCRAEACQAMGGEALSDHIRAHYNGGSQSGTKTRFCIEPVYCLGLCASAPALTLDGQPYARLTPAVFDQLIAGLEDES